MQLQKLIKRCGKPKLSCDTTNNGDGSVTATPVDSNETMKKVLDSVTVGDGFVDECVGHNLKDEVFRKAKSNLSLKSRDRRKRTRKQKLLKRLQQ